MKTPDLENNYDALCLEHEKQAALLEVLRRALNSGPMSPETLTGYVLVMEAQNTAAASAASTSYETAIGRDNNAEGNDE